MIHTAEIIIIMSFQSAKHVKSFFTLRAISTKSKPQNLMFFFSTGLHCSCLKEMHTEIFVLVVSQSPYKELYYKCPFHRVCCKVSSLHSHMHIFICTVTGAKRFKVKVSFYLIRLHQL